MRAPDPLTGRVRARSDQVRTSRREGCRGAHVPPTNGRRTRLDGADGRGEGGRAAEGPRRAREERDDAVRATERPAAGGRAPARGRACTWRARMRSSPTKRPQSSSAATPRNGSAWSAMCVPPTAMIAASNSSSAAMTARDRMPFQDKRTRPTFVKSVLSSAERGGISLLGLMSRRFCMPRRTVLAFAGMFALVALAGLAEPGLALTMAPALLHARAVRRRRPSRRGTDRAPAGAASRRRGFRAPSPRRARASRWSCVPPAGCSPPRSPCGRLPLRSPSPTRGRAVRGIGCRAHARILMLSRSRRERRRARPITNVTARRARGRARCSPHRRGRHRRRRAAGHRRSPTPRATVTTRTPTSGRLADRVRRPPAGGRPGRRRALGAGARGLRRGRGRVALRARRGRSATSAADVPARRAPALRPGHVDARPAGSSRRARRPARSRPAPSGTVTLDVPAVAAGTVLARPFVLTYDGERRRRPHWVDRAPGGVTPDGTDVRRRLRRRLVRRAGRRTAPAPRRHGHDDRGRAEGAEEADRRRERHGHGQGDPGARRRRRRRSRRPAPHARRRRVDDAAPTARSRSRCRSRRRRACARSPRASARRR